MLAPSNKLSTETRRKVTQARLKTRIPKSIVGPTRNEAANILDSKDTDIQKRSKLLDLGLTQSQVQSILTK